jgi:hypothetical protein
MEVGKAGRGNHNGAGTGVPSPHIRSFRAFDTGVRLDSMNPAVPHYANYRKS